MTYIKRIERVALAVPNLEEAKKFFEDWFDAKFRDEENIEDMGIRYRPFEVGESLMELLEPTREDSPVAKFLKQMGLVAPQPEATLKITKGSLPGESKVVLLEPRFALS